MMNLKDKKTLIVGLGRTGLAAARFLHQKGARVLVADTADETQLGDSARALREMGVALELGAHRTSSFQKADLIIVSPGVSHTIDPIAQARARGIPLMSEVELASRFIKEPIVAVTGTNGKTTTTELLGQMLKNSGISVFVGGNIGNPLIEYAGSAQKMQVVVAEISSFQLDTIERFRPKVSVLLNITADHLDRYPDFEAYVDSKIRVFSNQQADDVAVLYGSDPLIRAKTKKIKSQRLFFPALEADEQGAVLNGKRIILNLNKLNRIQSEIQNQVYLDIAKIRLRGRHNFENACAATLAALASGATLEGIQKTLDHFKGLAHRLEPVATVNGVHYYNDSKATNVDGVLRALDSFSRPVLLLMGGRDKGSDFSELQDHIRAHAKELIVMGEAAEAIRAALGQLLPTKVAASMQDAVTTAFQDAEPEDVVLFSPGCASFDWYSNYAERGDDFRRAVEEVKKKAANKA
ncbi:MAG: UDP-N-acetylmuramoyl-L-alanine--D-glutamate ligase [Desulfobacterales bacterium]|nr:UDP-N-acetylmuramoyl-L-alanine--D-glutamate ligase [Desulfobacterales bacterium]